MIPIILSIVLLQCDPSDQMCFPIPQMPTVPAPTAQPVQMATPAHSAGYPTQQSEMSTQVGQWVEPIESVNGEIGVWLGATAIAPDASGGDFDTGLAPIQETGTAIEFAEDLGDKIGSVFEMVRTIAQIDTAGIGAFFLFLIAVAAWFAIVHILRFVLSFGDLLVVIFDKVYTWVMEFIPL